MELSSRSKHPLLAPLSSDKTDSRGARKIERERRTLGTWALGETNVGHQHPAIYPSLPVAHVWKPISYRTDEFIDGDYRKDPRNVRFSARSRNCTYNWYLKGEVMTYESRSSRSLADLFHFAANALVCASRPLPRCKTYRLGHRQPRQTFLVASLPPSLPCPVRLIDVHAPLTRPPSYAGVAGWWPECPWIRSAIALCSSLSLLDPERRKMASISFNEMLKKECWRLRSASHA